MHQVTKITKVKAWREDLQLSKPYTIAYKTISHIENVFVYIEIGEGLYGMGAGCPAAFVTGETVENAIGFLQQKLEVLLLGKDIRHFYAIMQAIAVPALATPAARAAIDIALYDVWTKWLRVPLVHYLGQQHRSLPTSITIGILSLEETLAEAIAHVGNGFKIIKLKVGKTVEEDIETVAKLREQIGKKILLRVDANQGYSVQDVEHFVAQTIDYNVEFIEQALPPQQLEQMLQLSSPIRQQSAADEDLIRPHDALKMAQLPQPYGIYNIKLMKCGGVYPALQIADIARLGGIDLMWGCNDESIVSITAALHAALACPHTKYLDLDGSFDLAKDVVTGGFILENGCLRVDENKVGLGVELL